MENVKLYLINLSALAISFWDGIIPPLQAISLVAAIIYTFLRIIKQMKDGKN